MNLFDIIASHMSRLCINDTLYEILFFKLHYAFSHPHRTAEAQLRTPASPKQEVRLEPIVAVAATVSLLPLRT